MPGIKWFGLGLATHIIPPKQKEPGRQRAGDFEERTPRPSEDLEHEDKKNANSHVSAREFKIWEILANCFPDAQPQSTCPQQSGREAAPTSNQHCVFSEDFLLMCYEHIKRCSTTSFHSTTLGFSSLAEVEVEHYSRVYWPFLLPFGGWTVGLFVHK